MVVVFQHEQQLPFSVKDRLGGERSDRGITLSESKNATTRIIVFTNCLIDQHQEVQENKGEKILKRHKQRLQRWKSSPESAELQ